MGTFTPGAYGSYQAGLAGQAASNDNTYDTFRASEAFTPGYPVFGYKATAGINHPKRAYKYKKDTGKLVASGDLVTSNSTIVTVNGVASAAVVFATDHATTMATLVNAIKAIPVSAANPNGVEAVLDSTDASGRTILIRTQGAAATVSAATTLGAGQATWSATYASGQIFLGVVTIDQSKPPVTIGGSFSYAVRDPISVCVDGEILAEAVTGSLGLGKALIDASTGKFGPTGEDPGTRFRDSLTANNLAKVRISTSPVAMTYGDRF